MSEPKAQPRSVALIVTAQERMREAADALISARLDTVRVSAISNGEFRGTPLDREMDQFAGRLTEDAYELDGIVRRLAELIDPPDAGAAKKCRCDTKVQGPAPEHLKLTIPELVDSYAEGTLCPAAADTITSLLADRASTSPASLPDPPGRQR